MLKNGKMRLKYPFFTKETAKYSWAK